MSAWTAFRSQGVALYAFAGDGTAQLALNPGDVVEVTQESSGWYRGVLLASNKEGIFPASYIRLYDIPPEEASTPPPAGGPPSGSPAGSTGQPRSRPQSSSGPAPNDTGASVSEAILPQPAATPAQSEPAPIPESQRAQPAVRPQAAEPAAPAASGGGGGSGGPGARSADTSAALQLVALMGGEIETGDGGKVAAAAILEPEPAPAPAPAATPATESAAPPPAPASEDSTPPPPAPMRETADGPPPPPPDSDSGDGVDGPPPPPVAAEELRLTDAGVPPPPAPDAVTADDETMDDGDSEPVDSDYDQDDDDDDVPPPPRAAVSAESEGSAPPPPPQSSESAIAPPSRAPPPAAETQPETREERAPSTLTVPGGSDSELGRSSVVTGGASELLKKKAQSRLTTHFSWPQNPQPVPGSFVLATPPPGPKPKGDAVATFHTSLDDEFDPRIMRRVVAGARNDNVPPAEVTLLRDLYLEMDASLTHRYQVKAHEVLLQASPIMDPSMFDKVMRFFSSKKEDKSHASIPTLSLSKHQLDFGLPDNILPLDKVVTDTITVANTHKKLKAGFDMEKLPTSEAFSLTATPMSKSIGPNSSIELKFEMKLLKSTQDLQHLFKLNVKNALSHYIAMSFEAEKQVFGVPWELVDMVEDGGYQVPEAVIALRDYLFNNGGLDIVGIFRLAADESEMPSLKKAINQGNFTGAKDLNCVSTLIKVYFREMPVPLLNVIPADKFMAVNDLASCVALAGTLPQPNKGVFEWLLDMMVTVTKNSKVNLMNTKAISIVIAPNLFLPSKDDDPMKGLLLSQKTVNFVQHNLINRLAVVHGITSPDD